MRPYEEGGLKMYDINVSLSTLKISWFRRLQEGEAPALPSENMYPSLNKIKRSVIADILKKTR